MSWISLLLLFSGIAVVVFPVWEKINKLKYADGRDREHKNERPRPKIKSIDISEFYNDDWIAREASNKYDINDAPREGDRTIFTQITKRIDGRGYCVRYRPFCLPVLPGRESEDKFTLFVDLCFAGYRSIDPVESLSKSSKETVEQLFPGSTPLFPGHAVYFTGGDNTNEGDALYDQAVQLVLETRRASVSGIQRRLKIGYNSAARMVEDMEAAGVVSSLRSNGSREVLAPPPPRPSVEMGLTSTTESQHSVTKIEIGEWQIIFAPKLCLYEVDVLVEEMAVVMDDVVASSCELENLFNARSFAKFWGDSQRIYELIRKFQDKERKLSVAIGCYTSSIIKLREITLPERYRPPEIDSRKFSSMNIEGEVKRVDELVQHANSDYEFTSIFLQMKTNDILKVGFTGVTASVDGLVNIVKTSFDELSQAIEVANDSYSEALLAIGSAMSESNKLLYDKLDEQIDVAKKQGEKLDDIRFRRFPGTKVIPSYERWRKGL